MEGVLGNEFIGIGTIVLDQVLIPVYHMRHFLVIFLLLCLREFNSQINLNSSLTACYTLDGNAIDQVNALNGTLSSVTNTLNRFNQANSAMAFAGNSLSLIELPNSALLKSPEISFSAWVRFNQLNIHQYIVFTHNGCQNYHEGYMLAVNDWVPGGFRLQMAKADNSCSLPGQATLNGTQVLNPGIWYHVGFYAGADSLKLYLNGALESTLANSNPLLYNPTTKVYLGGSNVPAFHPALDGSLDNVRFYNRKLSGAEMLALYIQDPICRPEITRVEQNSPYSNPYRIYPNPTENHLFIDCDEILTHVNYSIEDNFGRKILMGSFEPSNRFEINCSDLEPGLYFIRINSDQKETVLKFTRM